MRVDCYELSLRTMPQYALLQRRDACAVTYKSEPRDASHCVKRRTMAERQRIQPRVRRQSGERSCDVGVTERRVESPNWTDATWALPVRWVVSTL